MMSSLDLLSTLLLVAGAMFIMYQRHKLNQMVEEAEARNEMLLAMAEELESLGSPNVKIFRKE
jgi:hypothetical protein